MPLRDGSVRMRLPLLIPDGVKGAERNIENWHMFSQRDVGSVLGIDLDQHENAHMVRKKLESKQCAFTTFGDNVVDSDLGEARRNDFQVSGLFRSLSTPCNFLTKEVETCKSGQLFKVVGGLRCCPKMKSIIKQIIKGIECGVEPLSVTGGLGGAYYFRNAKGENVAIVKPSDEEAFAPNNPKGFVGKSLGELSLSRPVRVGETGIREVAAYLLDHKHFAGVPPTALVKVAHHVFHTKSTSSSDKKSLLPIEKIGSCQQFVSHDFDASDHGSSRFSVLAVHRIGILDIRIFNTDRHSGNILVRKAKPVDNCSSAVNEALDLIPIDHGLCLPESLGDPYFEWLHWPQSSLPFSEEELAYIQQLDEHKDVEMLRKELPTLREACLRVLVLSTTVLKRGAIAGLCLSDIGEMMSRDGIGGASQLELLCMQAKDLVDIEFGTAESVSYEEENAIFVCSDGIDDGLYEQFEFEMDEDEDMLFSSIIGANGEENIAAISGGEALRGLEKKLEYVVNSPGNNSRAHLMNSPRMIRSVFPSLSEQEEINVFVMGTGRSKHGVSPGCKVLASPRSARSYKSISFNNRKQMYMDYRGGYKALASETIGKGNKSAPPTFSLGDMNDKEWNCFLDHFKGLLQEALLAKCSQNTVSRQRLGISCQF